MPTEAIYDQLASASDPDAIKKILEDAGAKIVYDSDAPDAAPAGDDEGAEPKMPPPFDDAEETAEGEPPPDNSLKAFKKKAIDKAFPPEKP